MEATMNFYRFYGYIYGDKVAGIVEANNPQEAKQALRRTYRDYYLWKDITLEKVTLNENGVCEVYYGC